MESWRKEFYGSDYGSEYLMHYRTKGSRNGISRTEGYRAIGSLAKGISTASSNRPNSRKTTVSGQATGGLGRKGSVPLGETAGNFKPTGPNGLNESYAANRPTTPPAGKTAEEPKPNGLTTEQAENLKKGSVYTSKDGRVIGKEWVEEHDKLAGGISNDHAWRENVARIDPALADGAVRESMVDDLISKDGWFFRASETLGEDNAKSVLNKYLDEYIEYYKSIDKNKLYLKNDKSKDESKSDSKKPAPKPMKKDDRVIFDRLASQQPSVYDREKVQQQATENAINKIKNEPIGSVLKDYAGIVGDVTKLMAKGTLASYASMLPGHNDAARVIGESVQNDAKKLGYRIGTRIAKNRIRKGK